MVFRLCINIIFIRIFSLFLILTFPFSLSRVSAAITLSRVHSSDAKAFVRNWNFLIWLISSQVLASNMNTNNVHTHSDAHAQSAIKVDCSMEFN